MSTIDKLSIRGIRSFGHEDHDRQVIEFFHPLTLITGHNGAGKTTVIESLRYITTGEAPPMAKNSAFIHDPKVAHETSVKAQIKLSFKDVAGKRVVVTRNVEATQKLKNIQTKTLEGVICRMNDYGEKTSLSSKCAEIDREMIASLGVAKPVLNSVIFCHQEDSNWPLGEGRALKVKFDEIFAATRYIKALDSMTKFRKEQNQTIGIYKTEIKFLKQFKEKAKQLHDECEEKKTQLTAAKDSVNRIKEQIVPIEGRIREIDAQDEEVASRCTELEKFKAEKKQMKRNMKDLEDGLEQIFQGSVEELRRIYREHQETLQQKQVTLKQNDKQLVKTRRDVDSIRNDKSRLLLQQGKLEQEEKQYRDTVSKRNKKINQAAQELNIPGYDDLGDDSQIQDFVKIVDDKARKMEQDVAECKQKYEEQESGLDKQIQGLRDEKTKLQHTVQTKSVTMKENKGKIKRIADDLSKMDASAQRLPELEEDLKRTEKNLEEVQGSVDVDKLKDEIQGLQVEKKDKETAMSKLSKEMSAISMQSKARAQLEMYQKEKNSKEDQIKKIRGRHEDEVTRLMGHFPTSNMRASLSDFIMQKQSEIKEVSRKLEKARGEMSSFKANKKMRTEELKKLKDELNTSREAVLEVCDDEEDLDQSVQSMQQSINNLQSEKGALTGSTHLFERYIRTLEKDDAMCPLCHRGFDERPEIDELVQELRDKLRLAPTKLQEKERSLTQQRDKLTRLMELKPVRDKMSKLSSGEIPNVKSKLTTLNSSIEKLTQSISEQESAQSFLQEEERTANDMKPDIWQMERCQGELKEVERKIATQSVQFSGTDANRTIQQVNSERQSLELSLDHVSRKLEQRQQQLEEQTDRVQMLQTSINSITSEKLRLTMMVQQEEKLQEQQAELKLTNQTYQREIKEAKDQLQPVENRLSELSEDKNDVMMQKEADVEELKFKISKLREKKNEIASLTADINRYLNGGNRDKLETCQQDITDVQQKLERLEQQMKKLTDSINQIQEDLARQQVHERELADNLQLRKKQKEVEEVDRQMATVEEQLAGYDTAKLKAEKRKLNNEYSKLFKDKNHADGRQVILHEDVKKFEKELKEDSYKDAGTKYSDMMIDLRTTEIANEDLEKYCKALDKAIMGYHSLKMSEINKMIRNLWRTTYKGNDIDYVEIRSEDETGAGQATRRTYHYRVVMVKGDTSLDMRGRCSAGQKVLASLIIRLALAETFCLNCGILALDEPTTNLDKDNIESLAHALVDIIKSREGQRNFQLIVITHDEDFVELLGRSDYTDYFYRIQKNDEYKSVVRRLKIESLHNVTEED